MALPLEAEESQSHIRGALARVGLQTRGSRSSLNLPHTITVHIFLMKPQIHSPPPRIPPLPAPVERHSAAWQHLFIGGQKALHCFPAIHSSCLKVPGSKGRKGHVWLFRGFLLV